ncbi:MAG: FecCD family ABC transporter permease [Propioniciclava sp.]
MATLSLGVGRFDMAWSHLFPTILAQLQGQPATSEGAVLFAVRMPRILLAVLVGAALSASGAAYQGLFRNPLVSPDLLGVASGASVGACLSMLLGWPTLATQVLAFTTGLLAVVAAVFVSSAAGRSVSGGMVILVLAGVVVSSLCSATTALLKYLAPEDNTLPEITFWLMGSFARSAGWINVQLMLVVLLVGITPLMLLRWSLNVMTFGDLDAAALGLNPTRIRLIVIACSTLLTATAVAMCGVIGWVGLVIPHLCRFVVGPSFTTLLPASVLSGGLFMVIVDDLARTMTAGEIPLGVLTAFVGAPAFILLLRQGRRVWTT